MSRRTSNYTSGRYAGISASYTTLSNIDSSNRTRRSPAPSPERSSPRSETFYRPIRNDSPLRDSPYSDRDMSLLSNSFSHLWTDSMSRYPVHSDGLYDASTLSRRYVDRRLHGSDLYAARGNLGSGSLLTNAYSPSAYRTDHLTRRSTTQRDAARGGPISGYEAELDMPNFGATYDNPSPAWYLSRASMTRLVRDSHRSRSPSRRTSTNYSTRSPSHGHRATRGTASSNSRTANRHNTRGFDRTED